MRFARMEAGDHAYADCRRRLCREQHPQLTITHPTDLPFSSKDDGTGHYWRIDGTGRYYEAKKHGLKSIACIVFPPLTLSQRIVLREVLNSAQEPIDPPLILRDLQTMADELRLDIRNSDDAVEELLSYSPVSFAAEMQIQCPTGAEARCAGIDVRFACENAAFVGRSSDALGC